MNIFDVSVVEETIDLLNDILAIDNFDPTLVDETRQKLKKYHDAIKPKDMETAPKDRPILAYCIHNADPYYLGENCLTIYGGTCEYASLSTDGWNVIEYGGGGCDTGEYGAVLSSWPDTWFKFGSEFEEVVNPIFYIDLPPMETFPMKFAPDNGAIIKAVLNNGEEMEMRWGEINDPLRQKVGDGWVEPDTNYPVDVNDIVSWKPTSQIFE
jgi:hypothetical protein